MFLDSSPDRWGRVLMQRREAQLARAEDRKERRLLELDYLLGVYDGHRMGGLRYRLPGGAFLDDNTELASPPWTSLRELEQGAHPTRDLEQLWRRIAFFVCVSNVDDHLRNHGFLLELGGWSLAPAYDMNPQATGGGLTLNISETDNAQDLSLVRGAARHFRLTDARASEILEQVVGVVCGWRKVAAAAGLSRTEQDRMAPAFRAAEEA